MTMQEIRKALMGKVIGYYDGFHGSCSQFTIGHIENANTSVRVFTERGKGWGVFIPKNIIPELLQSGKYTKNGEIERCSYKEEWSLPYQKTL